MAFSYGTSVFTKSFKLRESTVLPHHEPMERNVAFFPNPPQYLRHELYTMMLYNEG